MDTKIEKLHNLTSLITKGTTPSNIGETFTESGIMYFRSELIGKSKYIDKTSGLLFISQETHSKLKRSQLQENDILFSMAGAYLGKISIVGKEDCPSNTNQAVALIRLKDNVCNVEYIYYYMRQKWFNEYVCSLNSQAAQPNINLEQIGNLKIALPSLPIQRKIASILSTYDALIENNTKRIKLLEQMAENLYKEWFVRFRFPGHENVSMENGLPKGWKVEKIKDICDVTDGAHNTIQDSSDAKYYLLSCKNIKEGKLIIGENERTIDENTFLKLRKRTKLTKGDILMTSVGTLGEICLLKEEPSYYEFQRSVAIIKPNTSFVNSNFMYEMLKTMKKDFINAAHGAAQQCLFIGDINKISVCIPPIQISNIFNDKVQHIYDMILSLTKQNQQLTRQRDLLLPRLMSGKLEVKA